MAEYRRSAHAVFDLKYHVVWITKYRYKILKGRVAEPFGNTSRTRNRTKMRKASRSARPPSLEAGCEPEKLKAALAASRLSVVIQSTGFQPVVV